MKLIIIMRIIPKKSIPQTQESELMQMRQKYRFSRTNYALSLRREIERRRPGP